MTSSEAIGDAKSKWNGQPAATPWRLALVTVMQFAENLTDRQSAAVVRARLDWKHALGLDWEDGGSPLPRRLYSERSIAPSAPPVGFILLAWHPISLSAAPSLEQRPAARTPGTIQQRRGRVSDHRNHRVNAERVYTLQREGFA
jgi:hypothetical protein